MEKVKRSPDQKFAVYAYAVAVLFSTVASVVVQMTVDVSSNLVLYLSYLLPQVGYIGVFCIMYFYVYKNGLKDLLKRENVVFTEYLFAVLIAVGLLLFAVYPNNLIVSLFKKIGLNATVVVPKFNAWYDYVLCSLLICVLPAIGEELIFRKAFCDGMDGVKPVSVIFLAGLAFSLSHLNPAQTVHQFVLGCVLAAVYVATRNITLTMLMHMINNFLALYLEKITGAEIWSKTAFVAPMCALGALLVALGLFFVLRKRKVSDEGKTGKIEKVTVIMFVVLAVLWTIMLAVSFVGGKQN